MASSLSSSYLGILSLQLLCSCHSHWHLRIPNTSYRRITCQKHVTNISCLLFAVLLYILCQTPEGPSSSYVFSCKGARHLISLGPSEHKLACHLPVQVIQNKRELYLKHGFPDIVLIINCHRGKADYSRKEICCLILRKTNKHFDKICGERAELSE